MPDRITWIKEELLKHNLAPIHIPRNIDDRITVQCNFCGETKKILFKDRKRIGCKKRDNLNRIENSKQTLPDRLQKIGYTLISNIDLFQSATSTKLEVRCNVCNTGRVSNYNNLKKRPCPFCRKEKRKGTNDNTISTKSIFFVTVLLHFFRIHT
jgi:glutaredoxin